MTRPRPAGASSDRACPAASTRPVRLSALTLGFAAIVVQTLVLRELMVAWLGDETSFGLALTVWLLTAGLGSALAGRFITGAGEPRRRLATALAALALLSPLGVLAARAGRLLLGVHVGELAGPGHLLLAATLAAGPFALIAGAAFSLTVDAFAAGRTDEQRDAAARVYAIEAAGAVCAGVLLSFVLLPTLLPIPIAGICAFLLTLAAASLLRRRAGEDRPRGRRPAPLRLVLLVSGLLAVTLLSPLGTMLDRAAVRGQWSELGFVLSRDSVHGRVVAARRGTQLSVYESGVLAGSTPDRLTAEEAVHIPMLEHPAPADVLLVGGGLGGTIAEVLKHPSVVAVDYVELDPSLLTTAREAFSDSLLSGLSDPRVHTRHGDARLFIRTTRSTYDVVILNVPDPTTTQLNRFYTVEFFEEVRRLLGDDGILGLTVSGSENYVPPELAELLLSIRGSLAAAFPHVGLLPGDPCHLVAGGPATTLIRGGDEFATEIERRGISARFIARHYLEDRFSPARLSAFDETLSRSTSAGLNRDLSPRGYFSGLVLRSLLRSGTSRFFETARRVIDLPLFMALGGVIVLAFGIVPRLLGYRAHRTGTDDGLPTSSFARAVVLSVVVVGFSEMSLEISAIVAYQSLYGYVYGRLALITAAFMAGLGIGGWIGIRLAPRVRHDTGYIILHCGLTAVPVGFAVVVARLGSAASGGPAGAAFFPAIVAASAVLAGIQFPLAASILRLRDGTRLARQGGALYAADLFGAALGAVTASLLLLPLLGTAGTMTGLAVLNVAVLVSLALTASRANHSRV